jgi:hypothetical protein
VSLRVILMIEKVEQVDMIVLEKKVVEKETLEM